MRANELYLKLDEAFDIAHCVDDWSFMDMNEYISEGFKRRYMGLVLDNAEHIGKVYTATFPDIAVIDRIFERNERDVLLFSHHAMGYHAQPEGFPFYNLPVEYLEKMRERRIAFYMLHAPLDKYGVYSTSVSLANALALTIDRPFCRYAPGLQVGVLCGTGLKTAEELAALVRRTVGHEVRLYPYGEKRIKDGVIAIAAGGGSYPFVAEELAALGVNVYLTGFTRPLPHFEPTMEFHRLAQTHGINVIGATHYSTEKYACMAMVEYFQSLGLAAEFLPGEYFLEDL